MSKPAKRISRAAAIHEGGHAIAACRYGHGFHAVHTARDVVPRAPAGIVR